MIMDAPYTRPAIPSKHVAAFYATYFGTFAVLVSFLGPYLRAQGLSPVAIGVITAAVPLGKIVWGPLVGAAVDRGRWFTGILSAHLAVGIAAAAALPLLEGFSSHLLTMLLVGFAHGAVLPLVEAAVLDRVSSGAYGRLRLWGSVGFIVAALTVSAVLSAGLAWFPLTLAVALGLIVPTCWPLERSARPEPATSSERSPLPAVTWIVLLTLTLHQVGHGPYYAFLSIHLTESGYAATMIGALWALGTAAEILTFLLGDPLERRLGLPRMLMVALALTPVRWLLLALPPHLPTLLAAQLLHAVTYGLAHLAAIQLVQRQVPANATRRAQALYSGLTFGVGLVAGQTLAGPIYDAFGGRGAFAAAGSLAVLVALAWTVVGAPRLAQQQANATASRTPR
jgi:PPP family 3-phenylpropionic acid transporter